VIQDLRSAVRVFRKNPGFTFVVVFTLALAIGANSAIFSVVSGVLLKPLPFEDPEKLVGVWHTASGLGLRVMNSSPATYFTYREESRVFEDIGLWQSASVTVTGLAEPQQVDALLVTDGMFPVLRARPVLGRSFTRADDTPGSPETVVLSYAYWQRKFGGDPAAIGRRIVIDGRARDVIGILPQSFRFLHLEPALFLPLRFNRAQVFIGQFSYQGIARLKPGFTLEQANGDVARMLPLMLEKFPLPPGLTLQMVREVRLSPSLHPLKEDAVGDVGKVLWVLLGTVGIVLLIACANVANLLLVRAEGRQQELAIRAALGADWGRLARGLLLESMTLGMVGGAAGLLLAHAGIRLLVAMGPARIPRLQEISMDPGVLLFTLGISLAAGLLFGLIPVFRYARPHLVSALKEGGRALSEGKERHRARSVLAVSQIALALVLLIGSGLMMRTFQALRKVEPGFVRPQEVLTLRISIPSAQIADPEQAVRTHEQIMRRIGQVPGVVSVGLSSGITMDGSTSWDPIFVEGFPAPEGQLPPVRRFKWISERYFETMGNPLLAGRDFTWRDIYSKAHVVLVTENFAREYWKDPAAALGKRIRSNPKDPWREIVGVVGNVRDDGADQKAPAVVYWPMMMKDFFGNNLFVRRTQAYAIRSSRTGTLTFLKEVQAAVWSVNPNLPVANVRTLEEIHGRSMARTSFTLVMLGIASGVALILGVVGIYGVISYSVSQRTREIGIRMALGAEQGEISRLFLAHGLLLTGMGVALGLGGAVALTRVMSALLFDVSPLDPATYCAVSMGLIAAALLASYLPARRAAVVDPVEALRWQ